MATPTLVVVSEQNLFPGEHRSMTRRQLTINKEHTVFHNYTKHPFSLCKVSPSLLKVVVLLPYNHNKMILNIPYERIVCKRLNICLFFSFMCGFMFMFFYGLFCCQVILDLLDLLDLGLLKV